MAYYYHVKIYPKQDPTHWEWKSDLHREQLEQRVLVPYREGRPITIDGKTTRMDDLKCITIDESDAPWDTHTVCKDVTDKLITGPPGSESGVDAGGVKDLLAPTDSRQVFVVHGRNEKARIALFAFLRSIGLEPLESAQVRSSKCPTPLRRRSAGGRIPCGGQISARTPSIGEMSERLRARCLAHRLVGSHALPDAASTHRHIRSTAARPVPQEWTLDPS